MEKLPPEILHRISILLDLQQRLICLTICRSWWRVLELYNLFHHVKLQEENGQFNKIMGMFERLPDRAAQVLDFQIVLKKDTIFNIRKLFDIFPNARKVKVSSAWGTWSSSPSHFIENMTHSKSRVEYLSDVDHCELVSQIIYSNLGGRLKELDLTFYSSFNRSTIVSQLKDLPVLKKLGLWSPNIKFLDLEHIHTHIPSIQDFTLASIDGIGGDLPSDIVPATSITKFKFNHSPSRALSRHTNIHAQIYQYITKKYINLTDIEYEDEKLPHYDLSNRKQIYLHGLVDFYKLIGPTQSKLNFYGLPDDVDVFDTLDAVGSRVNEMYFHMCDGTTLVEYLSRSNQSNYIEKLDILCKQLESIHLINDMTALTTLNIRFYDNRPIHLVDYLAAPSLRNLSIECIKLVVEPFQIRPNSIENLRIKSDRISSGLGDIISSCFPNLARLDLTGDVKENVNITLISPHFQKAKFCAISRSISESADHAFSFKSPAQIDTEYYFCYGGKDMRKAGQRKRVKHDDVQSLPILSVVALSQKRLNTCLFFEVLSF